MTTFYPEGSLRHRRIRRAHKAAFAQLRQLLAQVQCIKVVSHDGVLRDVVCAYCSVRVCENEPTLQQEIYCGN
jgi:hypothetical protein